MKSIAANKGVKIEVRLQLSQLPTPSSRLLVTGDCHCFGHWDFLLVIVGITVCVSHWFVLALASPPPPQVATNTHGDSQGDKGCRTKDCR